MLTRLFFLLAVGINHGHLVFTNKELGQLIFVLPVITDRQAGHQVNRDKTFNQLSRGGQGKNLGKFSDELCLIKSKEAHITLPLSEFTDKIRFAVDLDLQVFFIFTGEAIISSRNWISVDSPRTDLKTRSRLPSVALVKPKPISIPRVSTHSSLFRGPQASSLTIQQRV